MEEKKEEKARVRKAYAAKGSRSQTMYSFRLDDDNNEWLHAQHNMGRYLNDLIRADRQHTLGQPAQKEPGNK